MSNNPIYKDCPANVWTLVASGVTGGFLNRILSTPSKYLWCYRKVRDPEPTDITEGITIFDRDDVQSLPVSTGLDIYIYPIGADGRVRLDNITPYAETAEQDQISSPLDMYLSRKVGVTNLTSDIPTTDEGDYYAVTETFTFALDDVSAINMSDPKGNPWLEIWEGSFFFQAEIINLVGNNVSTSMPIGLPFTTNATVLHCRYRTK
jgi:hypothetical protein